MAATKGTEETRVMASTKGTEETRVMAATKDTEETRVMAATKDTGETRVMAATKDTVVTMGTEEARVTAVVTKNTAHSNMAEPTAVTTRATVEKVEDMIKIRSKAAMAPDILHDRMW